MKKIKLLLLFSLYGVKLFARAPQTDSLKKLLSITKEDTVKADAFRMLSFYD